MQSKSRTPHQGRLNLVSATLNLRGAHWNEYFYSLGCVMSFMNVPCTSQTPHSLIKPVCPNKFDTDGDIWELRGVRAIFKLPATWRRFWRWCWCWRSLASPHLITAVLEPPCDGHGWLGDVCIDIPYRPIQGQLPQSGAQCHAES